MLTANMLQDLDRTYNRESKLSIVVITKTKLPKNIFKSLASFRKEIAITDEGHQYSFEGKSNDVMIGWLFVKEEWRSVKLTLKENYHIFTIT